MYRLIDKQGHEISLSGAQDWVAAVREGRVVPSTLVFDSTESRWRPAREMEVFQVAVAAMGGPHQNPAPPPPAPPVEKHHRVAPMSDLTPPEEDLRPQQDLGTAAPRKHGWPGVLHYGLTYLGAGICTLAAVVLIPMMLSEGEPGGSVFLVFIFLAGFSVLSFFLARGIQRFEPWARGVALVMAYLAVLGALFSMFEGPGGAERVGGMVGTILSIIFIVYFHGAKARFTGVHGWDQGIAPSRTFDGGVDRRPAGGPGSRREGVATEDARSNQEGTRTEDATVRVSCPECGNAEDIPTHERYDYRAYQNFSLGEGLLTGGWTLTCMRCEHKVSYDPGDLQARAGA